MNQPSSFVRSTHTTPVFNVVGIEVDSNTFDSVHHGPRKGYVIQYRVKSTKMVQYNVCIMEIG